MLFGLFTKSFSGRFSLNDDGELVFEEQNFDTEFILNTLTKELYDMLCAIPIEYSI